MKLRPLLHRLATVAATGIVAFAFAACGERPQVVNYRQGTYQGKPDTRPYEGAPFSGDKTIWETQMRARAQSQNEYRRIR